MPLSDKVVWDIIRDWELPDFPAPKTRLARNRSTDDFEFCLQNDLILLRPHACGLIKAYRQWLFVSAVEGRRMQVSDLIAQAEALHRKAGANWAALVAALPEGVLSGEAVKRGPENDAEYQATLDRLANFWPDGELESRFWPAIWRYRVTRKLPLLLLPSFGFLAVGGLSLWAFDLGSTWTLVLANACFLGILGIVACMVASEHLGVFVNDDTGG